MFCFNQLFDYFSFLNNSRWIYLLIQFTLFFRLSGIAILIGHIGSNVFNYKKNLSKIFFTIASKFIIIFFLSFIANKFTNSEFSNLHYLGLIKEFNFNRLLQTIIFIFKPIICFIPLIFLLFFFKIEKKKFILEKFIFFLSIPLLIIGQPILGGEFVTGNNIFRLSSLSLPFFIIYFAILFKPKISLKKNFIYFLLINFIYSFHPKYSILSFFID